MKTNNCKTTVGCASTHKWLYDEANKWGYPMWGLKKKISIVLSLKSKLAPPRGFICFSYMFKNYFSQNVKV
jgi:hypothetical protein